MSVRAARIRRGKCAVAEVLEHIAQGLRGEQVHAEPVGNPNFGVVSSIHDKRAQRQIDHASVVPVFQNYVHEIDRNLVRDNVGLDVANCQSFAAFQNGLCHVELSNKNHRDQVFDLAARDGESGEYLTSFRRYLGTFNIDLLFWPAAALVVGIIAAGAVLGLLWGGGR